MCVCVFGMVWGFLERERDFKLSILLPVVVGVSVSVREQEKQTYISFTYVIPNLCHS